MPAPWTLWERIHPERVAESARRTRVIPDQRTAGVTHATGAGVFVTPLAEFIRDWKPCG